MTSTLQANLRFTVTDASHGQGDQGSDTPAIEFKDATSAGSSAFDYVAVVLTVSSPTIEEVTLPISFLGSDLTRGTDWKWIVSATDDTAVDADAVTIPSGHAGDFTLYFEILTDSAGTIGMELLESFSGETLSGATLGDQTDHDLEVEEVGGGTVTVQFQTTALSVAEGDDSDAAAQVVTNLILSENNIAADTEVTVRLNTGLSTGTAGTDFDFTGDSDADGDVVYTFSGDPDTGDDAVQGATSRGFYTRVIGNTTTGQGARTAVYDIVSATNSVVVGTNSRFTLTITEDDSALPAASWEFATQDVVEGDLGEQVDATLNIVLSEPAPVGGTDVTIELDPASTAAVGTDVEVIAATYPIGEGKSSRPVPITVLGDISVEGLETLILNITAVSNGTVGSPATHTLNILDNDTQKDASVQLGFSQTKVNEGATLNVPVIFSNDDGSGGGPVEGFDVAFDVVGTGANPADPATDFVVTPSGGVLSFSAGQTAVAIQVQALTDAAQEGTEQFEVRLLSLSGNDSAIKLGADTERTIDLQDDFGSNDGVDGPLTDYDGFQRVAERQDFDHATPDMIVLPVGHTDNTFTNEAVLVPNDISDDGTEGVLLAAGLYESDSAGLRSGLHKSIGEFAEKVWRARHGPNGTVNQYAGSDSVPVGRKLDLVKIGCRTSNWVNARLCDGGFNGSDFTYTLQETVGGSLGFMDGKSGHIRWSRYSGNDTPRDIVVYTMQDTVNPEMVSVPKIRGGAENLIVDNIVFWQCNMRNTTADATSSIFQWNSPDTNALPTGQVDPGMFEFWDCAHTPSSYLKSGGTVLNGAERCVRTDAVAVIYRHRAAGMPWPPFYPGYEHYTYLGGSVGPKTYSDLDYSWHPDYTGDATWASSAWVNIDFEKGNRQAPIHHDAVFNSATGFYEGPAWNATNSCIQYGNRANYNAESDCSSGLIAFIRCNTSGFGDVHTSSAGQAYSLYGHNGEFLWVDCTHYGSAREVLNAGNGQMEDGWVGGGINIIQDYSGNSSQGPQGHFSLEQADDADRTYACRKMSLHGFFCGAKRTNKGLFKTYGVQEYDIRLWVCDQWPLKTQWSMGDDAMQPGDGYTQTFRIDKLLDPDTLEIYVGPLSAYGGWASGQKINYGTFVNSRRDNDEFVSLNAADIDNLPTHYPAAAELQQSNGVIAQEYAARKLTWDAGFMKIDPSAGSPAWSNSAFGSSGKQPTIQTVTLVGSSDIWISQDTDLDEFYADLDEASQSTFRVHWSVSGDTSAVTIETLDQSEWDQNADSNPNNEPDPPTWTSPGQNPHVLNPIRGKKGDGQATDAYPGPLPPFTDQIGQYYDKSWYRARAATSLSGTTTRSVTFTLSNGVNVPELEVPPGGGTYKALTASGNQSRTIKVLPPGGFPAVSWDAASQSIAASSLSNGQTISIPLTRSFAVNTDGRNYYTQVPVNAGFSGISADDFDKPLFATFQPTSASGDQAGSYVIEIENASAFDAGDTLVLTLSFAGNQDKNAQAGTTVAHTINFT